MIFDQASASIIEGVHRESMMTQPRTARCLAPVGIATMVGAEPQQPSLPIPTILRHTGVWLL